MDVNTSFHIVGRANAPHKQANPTPTSARSSGGVAPVEQPQSQTLLTPTPDALKNARQFQQNATYDAPDQRSALALNAYQSHERETKRDELRQLMGVDLFA